MSKQQWGHGFNTGYQDGEQIGVLCGEGKWEIKMSDVSDRLIFISNALRLPVEHGSDRTEAWWKMYVIAAANQIEAIARELPGMVTGVYEFQKDMPNDAPNETR